MADRPVVCMELDPVESTSRNGFAINRHCVLPAGHNGMHRSVDHLGDPVHEWRWLDEAGEGPLVVADRLF